MKQGCITFFQSVLCSKAGHTRFESQPVQQEPAKIQIVNGHPLGEDNGPAGGIPASILSLLMGELSEICSVYGQPKSAVCLRSDL